MQEQEIIEGNKLIAEFMGGIYSIHAKAWGFGNARIEEKPISIQGKVYENAIWAQIWEPELNYHKSWDWLMPVVGKIRSLYNSTEVDHSDIIDIIAEGCIEANILQVYEGVVEFIKWYNTNKNELGKESH